MRLRRMEISGFKSFGARVQLDVSAGLCAIVGPNGCGKSNVVDAIRWVMGEQSAKSLRGRTMEDVIFAGSQNRPPAGMAEVTLVFERDEKSPPPLPSLNFPEIRVTRILHRDGTSEYKLMNQTCRLKDIVDVFSGTGLGARSYAIIEQGKIASVIAARPDERRLLFEEAAQISRYRLRRKESEKRLEESRHHLERIGDIVRELESRLRQLSRQKDVALRYDELSRQLHRLDRWRFAHEGRELSARIAKARADVLALQERMDLLQTELAAARTQAQEIQLQKTEAETRYRQTVDALIDLEKRMAQVRSHGQIAQNQREQASRALENFQVRKAQLRQKLESAQALIQQSEEKRRHLESVVAVKQEELALLEQQFRTARNTRQDMEGRLAQKRAEVLQLEKSVSAHNALVESAARKRAAALERRQSLTAELAQVQQKLAEMQTFSAQCATKLQEARAQADAAAAACQGTERELPPLEIRLRELEMEARARRQSLTSLQGKLDYLEDFLRNHLDADERTRRFWELLAQNPCMEQVAGPLFDAFDADFSGMELLETVFAGKLQNPRLSQADAAVDAAGLAAGSCRGVGLELPGAPCPPAAGEPSVPETWIPLSQRVRVKDARFAHLLDGWFFVPSLSEALESRAQIPPGGGCVLPDGMALDSRGELRIHERGPQSSLRIQAERERLARQVEELSAALAQLEDEIARIRGAHEEKTRTLQMQKQARDAAMGALRELEMEENRLRAQGAALAQVAADRQKNLAVLQAELETAVEARSDAQVQQLEERRAELSRDMERLRETAARVDALVEQVQGAKVAVEGWTQKVESEKRLQARLEEEAAAQQAALDEIETGMEASRARIAEMEQEAQTHAAQLAELEGRLDRLRGVHDEVRANLENFSAQWESAAERIRKLERQLAPLSNRRGDLQNEIARLEGNLGYLQRDFEDRFPMERLDLLVEQGEFPDPFSDSQRQLREQVQREMESLRGDYNPNAVQEHAEVSERHEALHAQFVDLTKAVSDLEKAIEHITDISRERFLETFAGISQRFSTLFPRLFGGGSASLKLSDGDPLEAGVDVLVQMPGKRLQVMELISGGEKAMTAITLLFSMFLYRPSPLCVLDEVDAPLDETNVEKYNALLRELSRNTQFLVITHNRRTMEAMDQILGVTMEEPGCSTVYSVQLAPRR